MEIVINQQKVQILVIRKRIKNMYLRVVDKTTLKLTCSFHVDERQVLRFIEEKKDWIETHLKQYDSINGKKYIGLKGPYIYFYGDRFYFDIILSSFNDVLIDGNRICIYSLKEDEDYALHLFYQFAKKELEVAIFDLKEKWIKDLSVFGFYDPSIHVKKMKGKWGQCNKVKNHIDVNVHLIHFDIRCLDYVLLHELVHLVEFNHSKRFYQIIQAYMPDYKKYEGWLR